MRAIPNELANALIARILAGEEAAWSQLWQLVEPLVYETLRRPYFLGALSQREDDCRNIVVGLMERLRADGYRRLGTYVAARRARPGLLFTAWLLVVAKRVAIDYVRAHDEYIDRRHERDATSPGKWRVLETLIEDSRSPGARPSITNETAAHEILDDAADLPEPQRRALAGWLAGQAFAEIADTVGLPSAKVAERTVRATLERLRRRFRSGGPS